jgi:hypothetical protein
VTPDRSFRIALQPDLAARSGGKLATAQTCEAVSEAMPDSYYFASRGLVLPAGQNGGLPVVTVNTPEVDVQFLRVKPESLPAFLEQVGGRRERQVSGEEDGEGGYYDGYSDNQRRLKGTVGGWVLDELRAMSQSVPRPLHDRRAAQPPQRELPAGGEHQGAAGARHLRGHHEPARPLRLGLPGHALLRHRHRPAPAPACRADRRVRHLAQERRRARASS